MTSFNAIDLFSGCGGLSEGLRQAGFKVVLSVELSLNAVRTYTLNHPETPVIRRDIRDVKIEDLRSVLGEKTIDLVAGCPPCQGFSSMRRLNRRASVRDDRNGLVLEYLRVIKILRPRAIMMENVPALENYYLFKRVVRELKELGYSINYKVLDVSHYGVPQRRKRLVMLGSRIGHVCIPDGRMTAKTVREIIGALPSPADSADVMHKRHSHHGPRISTMIAMIPSDGGSRASLPADMILKCHRKGNVGFADVYGRLCWDAMSSTITGGCLNPSKGRFLHPEQNRGISAREAALLQTFPSHYQFPADISLDDLALLIGNALPPQFSFQQAKYLIEHLRKVV